MATAQEMPTPPPEEECDNCGDDTVMNYNDAEVENRQTVRSDSGSNWAGGSHGGDGGDGGDIRNGGYDVPELYGEGNHEGNHDEDCDGDVEESMTGNGGHGGAASTGGTVMTGNASAAANVSNTANHNRTMINRCACQQEEEECDCGRDVVMNFNDAGLHNNGEVKAYTGRNDAEGSHAGSGGQGGDVDNSGSGDVDESMTGNAGNGNSSGEGGLVQSGHSNSRADLVNVLNRNVTRIMR